MPRPMCTYRPECVGCGPVKPGTRFDRVGYCPKCVAEEVARLRGERAANREWETAMGGVPSYAPMARGGE